MKQQYCNCNSTATVLTVLKHVTSPTHTIKYDAYVWFWVRRRAVVFPLTNIPYAQDMWHWGGRKKRKKYIFIFSKPLFISFLLLHIYYLLSFSYLIPQIQTVQHDQRWSVIHRWTHTHNTLPAANDTWMTFSSTGLAQKNSSFYEVEKNNT